MQLQKLRLNYYSSSVIYSVRNMNVPDQVSRARDEHSRGRSSETSIPKHNGTKTYQSEIWEDKYVQGACYWGSNQLGKVCILV